MSKVKQTQLSQVANIIKNLVKNNWNPNIQAKSSSSWEVPLVLTLCQGVPFCQSMMISLVQPGGERNIETEILLKSNKKSLAVQNICSSLVSHWLITMNGYCFSLKTQVRVLPLLP